MNGLFYALVKQDVNPKRYMLLLKELLAVKTIQSCINYLEL